MSEIHAAEFLTEDGQSIVRCTCGWWNEDPNLDAHVALSNHIFAHLNSSTPQIAAALERALGESSKEWARRT